MLKARGGVLGLNDVVWREVGRRRCSMCNMDEIEDVVHFLGVCPVLGGKRARFFGRSILTREQCVEVLNGTGQGGWSGLAGYLKEAWRFRRLMVAEFNF